MYPKSNQDRSGVIFPDKQDVYGGSAKSDANGALGGDNSSQ